jgi:16S rRNA (cytosine1402-N4)-methyltransferase
MDRDQAHRPVLVDEVVAMLAPPPGATVVDCTVGLGGHAEALLSAGKDVSLVGMDVDESNLLRTKRRLEPFAPRVRLFQANFADLPAVMEAAGLERVEALLADLGVCSAQLDDPARGLSFQADGPLDMRLDPTQGQPAAELVNRLDERELADVIYRLGEERFSRRIARAIARAREGKPITRTGELAEIVSAAIPAPARRKQRIHPATRTFQALRIAVNDELASLDKLLAALPNVLTAGGRASIISFHSLEDRPVKRAFAAWAQQGTARLLTRKPVTAGEDERQVNPRSRSAKLRGIERIDL